MTAATIERARAAKAVIAALFENVTEVCAIGITARDGGYAVKVNVTDACARSLQIPGEVDGVPVIVTVVGDILPL
ncbi:MAG TPA: hypothetical protein VJZ00_15020 [Thermoanaerobaculia bacterium]|nr:hypothetical protein [Thermoanaerobaculia bacterium]